MFRDKNCAMSFLEIYWLNREEENQTKNGLRSFAVSERRIFLSMCEVKRLGLKKKMSDLNKHSKSLQDTFSPDTLMES